ncbi:galactosyltransferase-related protein [Rhodococcus sp. CSLK01-03]|uniref:Galactosyltransferase-related protein n=1 Tax=Rhodococcus indonesiensis TaxID=3055869 RepID=A0ABT7RTA4_9NOCA|nr:galactosyltransferase-related protein [Rhodococcus indonesiensis]MDM7490882.1 galactosyltransferase-related protein [Rhodococcus indonesiensis]
MKTTVITLVAGRHAHLRLQLRGLARSARTPDDHVVVSMGDPAVAPLIEAEGYPAHTVTLSAAGPLSLSAGGPLSPPAGGPLSPSAGGPLSPPAGGPLPLSTARNLGAECALARGAELLVFLDVDCIPSVGLLGLYERAASDPQHGSALLCGPVTYLPPPGPEGYDPARLERSVNPHPARPSPPAGAIHTGDEYDLFWSLSFATTRETWTAVGGFCTDYVGYGGEDTDFAQRAARAGVGLRWIGGAHAFHQHHPVSDPPVEHLHEILHNAAVFHRRWGRWPMTGWLTRFAEAGLARYDTVADRWVATGTHAGSGGCLETDGRGNSVGT